MYLSRTIFQISAGLIFVAIVYVWQFVEESERTLPIVILAAFFIILCLEYIREGIAKRKS